MSRMSVSITSDIVLFRYGTNGVPSVLLITRKNEPFQGEYALPGGYVDEGETFLEAAYRELQEETGITQVTLTPVKVYDAPDRDPRGRVISHAFVAWVWGYMDLEAGDDAEKAEWMNLNLISPAGVAFDHYRVIMDAYRVRT